MKREVYLQDFNTKLYEKKLAYKIMVKEITLPSSCSKNIFTMLLKEMIILMFVNKSLFFF